MKFSNIKSYFKIFFTKLIKIFTRRLRLQLLLLTICAILISSISFFVLNKFISYRFFERTYLSFNKDEVNHNLNFKNLINSFSSINEKDLENSSKNNIINEIINKYSSDSQIYLTDWDGNILYASKDIYLKKIDINNVINMNYMTNYNNEDYLRVYCIKLKNTNYFLIYEAKLKESIEKSYATGESTTIAILISVFIFITIFLLATKNKIKYIEYISDSLKEISKGNLDYVVEIKGIDELATLSSNINYMEYELKDKIEKERKSEQTKNELITNISHDLRTPLTSILGYISLIIDEEYDNSAEMKNYLNIAYSNIKKLKTLIEDLFTFTMVSNATIELNKSEISLNDIIRQLIFEVSPIYQEKNINIFDIMPKEKLLIKGDGSKLSRVFENLLVNALKYSAPNTNVEISSEENDNYFIIKMSNTCNNLSQDDLDKLYDRFYRSDKSRNAKTGGNGLGLAIAKSIITLHEGEIWAILNNNKVTFNVKIFK